MIKHSRYVFILILLLAMPALACDAVSGRFGDNGAEEGTISEESAGEPAGETVTNSGETGAEEAPSGPESLDLETLAAGVEDLNSYRVSMEMRVEGTDANGNPQTVSFIIENATVVDPPASQTDVTTEGIADAVGLNNLQFVAVGETSYTTLPGVGCISGDATLLGGELAANPFADIFNSSDVIGDVQGARRQLPDENVNGVEVYHFVFDETAFAGSGNELEQVDGHIYVSKEEGYVVRFVMDGTGRVFVPGAAGQQEEGTIHLEMNTQDVNQPIDIQPPADCGGFDLDNLEIPGLGFGNNAADTPYPLFPNNQNLFVLEDETVMSFQSEAPFADVVDFYQVEMPLAGYTPLSDGTVVTNDAAVLKYDQGGQAFFVTISQDGGTVFVQIVPE